MKKITLMFFMFLVSFCCYSQLAEEGFEGTWTTLTGTESAGGPADWAIKNVAGPVQYWIQGNGGGTQPAYEGSHSAYLNLENVANGTTTEDWLITKAFPMPQNPQLRFFSKLFLGGDQGTQYKIMISTTTGTVAQQLNSANYTQIQTWTELQLNPSQTDWTEKVVTIDPLVYPEGTMVYVAFVMMGDNGDRWDIDNVEVVKQCVPPTTLTASPSGTTANLSWTNPSNSPSWEIEVIPSANTPTGIGVVYTGTLPYTAPGLTPNTEYKYYVRSLCSDGGESTWVGPFTFTTTQIPGTLNYTQGFEDATTGWTLNNGTQTNQWVVGTATANGGTHSLYVSNDSGVSNAFNVGATSTVQAYRDLQMPAVVDQLTLSFDWKAYGESCCDYLRVWLVPASYIPVAGTAIPGGADFLQIGGNYNVNGSWTTVNTTINAAAYAGTVRRLVFEWHNDSSIGTQPPAAIDNVNLTMLTCPSPTALAISNLQESQVSFTWVAPTSVTPTYDYYFSTTNTAPTATTTPTGNTATTTHTETGLTPSTTYYFWVRSNCGDTNGNSFWVGPMSFSTPQIPAALNYSQGFEDANTGWTLTNTAQPNVWVVGTATSNGGTHSLYITNDNGVSNTFNVSSTSTVQAYRDIQMPATVDQLSLSFDWKAYGESCCDYLRVWLVPVTYTPVAGTAIPGGTDFVQIGGNYNVNGTWTTVNTTINAATFGGTIRRLVFEWHNDSSVGTQPPAAVDNVNLSVITCPDPSNVLISNLQEDQVTFTWTGPTSVTPTYDYFFGTSSTPPTATTTPTGNTATTTHTETGLTPSTTYYFWVRSNCGDPNGTSFWQGPVSFSTPQIPAQMDYSQNFEDDTMNGAWTLTNGTQTNKWFIGTATSNSPTHSLYITNDNGVSNAFNVSSTSNVQAYRDIQIPATAAQAQLSFDWKAYGESCCDYLTVWLVPVTYTPVAGTQIFGGTDFLQIGGNFNVNGTWTTYSTNLDVSAYAGTIRRLIFQWHNDSSVGTQPPAAVDNVNFSVITCPQPTDLTATTTTTTATLGWTNQGTATSWEIYIMPEGSAAPTATTVGQIVTQNPYTLTGLPASTSYQYYVRAVCSDTDKSFWSGPFLYATDPLCPEPTDIVISCLSADGASFSWTAGAGETSWEVVVAPASDPVPTSGTVVTSPNYTVGPLTPGTNYTFYVRAVCSDIAGYSSWAQADFLAPVVSPGDASPLCAGTFSAPVPNSNSGVVPGYGQVGCLFSTPNPVWYYVTIGNAGPLDFQLVQNTAFDANNNPIGIPLDVDFILFGPFTSLTDSCSQINLPGATPGNVVDCSYSAAAVETVNIPSTAQPGQVYALLITNYNGSAGQIILTQTNVTAPGAGTTSCAVTVELGPDHVLCATDQTTITATVNNPGVAQVYTYTWTEDGVAYTPTVTATTANTQTIQINNPGSHVYAVTITMPLQETPNITDTVTIGLSPSFTPPVPAPIVVCSTGGTAQADLSGINFLGTLDPTVIQVAGVYTSVANANTQTNPINLAQPVTVTGQDLYIVYRSILFPQCFQVVPLPVTLVTAPDGTIAYAGPFCSNGPDATVTQTGSTGGVFSSTTGLIIDPATGTISISQSTAGSYTVTYTLAATTTCPAFTTTTTVVINEAPEAAISYAATPYCSNAGTATVTIVGTQDGIFTADAGVTINPATGEIDLAASTAGTYTITYTIAAAGTCDAVVATTQVVITALPVATITYGTAPYCSDAGTAVVTTTATGGVYTADPAVIINATTGDIDLAATAPGTYTITYTIAAAGGCDAVVATASITVTALPTAGFTYAFPAICQNAGTASPTLNAGAVAGVYSADSAGLIIDPVTGVITAATSTPGTYIVTNTIAPANGCGQVTASTTIIVNPAPIPTFSYASVSYCQDETSNPAPILVDAAGTFTATPAGLVIDATTGVVNLAASTPGTYTVTNTIAGTTECPSVNATATITVTALPVVTVNQGCIDNHYVLSVSFEGDENHNADNVTFAWSTSAGVTLGTDATQTVTAPDTYFVTVTPVSGECPVLVDVLVESTSCLIPRGISPNNDGKNDNFDLSGFDVRKLEIFNRYGKEVYHKTNYTDEWFGQTESGDDLPTGTYFYMFERTNGETKTGWVYINRQVN